MHEEPYYDEAKRIKNEMLGKILKADCGFGLDDSKSSDALLLRCSDAEVSQDRAAVLTEYKRA